MTVNLKTKEILSGSFQIIVGIFFLYYISLFSRFQFLNERCQLSISKSIKLIIIQQHFEILISIGFVFSGVFLIINRKFGWISSIALSIVIAIADLLLLYLNQDNDLVYYSTLDYVFYVFLALIFLANAIFLISKDFRVEFNPTNTTWIIVLVIILLLIIDFLHFLFVI